MLVSRKEIPDRNRAFMLSSVLLQKLFNVLLRVTSLGAKLILTLYMGRYLGLADLGVYGLVFAAVMFATVVLGMRLDYSVARELVGAKTIDAMCKLRDHTIFLGCNYLLFAVAMFILALAGVASFKLMLIIFLISVLENLASAYTTNLTSMGQPILSTFLFFVRAGLWCFVVVALGVMDTSMRTVHVVLSGWAIGEVISLILTFWAWRNLPWQKVNDIPVNWDWVKKLAKQCFPIWMGTLGAAAALSVDRFVVSYFMEMEQVGIITFYGSFATALLALVQSGFYSFSYPKLIKYHRQGDKKAFWHETWHVSWQVSLFVLVAAIAIGWLIPFSAPFFQKPELATESMTLWLMLLSVWIRSGADTLYYVLYARNQDRALWVGGLLFLVPALLGNMILVPWLGLIGVGYSAILASLFLFFWRLAYTIKRS